MSNIVLSSKVNVDKYTEYVCDKFDLQNREENITIIPMLNNEELSTFNWNIGVIVGNSGSGKSTILNTLGEVRRPIYDEHKSIVSQFPNLSEEEVVDLLQSVGLSSVPIFLHNPNELSNGEKARFELCCYLANAKEGETILVDEFTSVVNRSSAKSLSYALQRYVRKKNLRIILSSCHFDIIEWLNPDWVFNLNKQKDGQCEIERLIYEDSKDYKLYRMISQNNILSDKYEV